MDNCARENKNQYVLAYLSYLVKSNLFNKVYLNFLKVGHTHIDVDALFRLVSNQMKRKNVFTIEQLHDAVKEGVKSHLMIAHVLNFPNSKKYVTDNDMLNSISGSILKYNA